MLEHNASREVCANLIPGEIERDLTPDQLRVRLRNLIVLRRGLAAAADA